MKTPGTNNKEEVKIHAEAKVEKKQMQVGHLRLHPGQILWEYDPLTEEAVEAKFKYVAKEMVPKQVQTTGYRNGPQMKLPTETKKTVAVQENKLYVAAINKKTAIRKAKRLIENHEATREAVKNKIGE